MDIDKKIVGARIKQIRLNKGLTLKALGKIINTSDVGVFYWEKGIHLPNAASLKTIAELGKTTVDELLGGNPLSKFSDEQLIEELRSRGHEDITKNPQD